MVRPKSHLRFVNSENQNLDRHDVSESQRLLSGQTIKFQIKQNLNIGEDDAHEKARAKTAKTFQDKVKVGTSPEHHKIHPRLNAEPAFIPFNSHTDRLVSLNHL